MKKLFFLANFVVLTSQLHSVTLQEYIKRNGIPQIQSNGTLHLSNKDITDITGLEKIPHLEQVRTLNLSKNKLQTVPSGTFNKLINLGVLLLNGNKLQMLPADVFNGLDNLKVLYLDNNRLRTLPETIFSGLDKLTILYLRDNNFDADFIPTLAEMVRTIPKLEFLNITAKDQALREYPFTTLKQLTAAKIAKNIGAYRNRLHELPSDILDLLSLTPQEKAEIEQRREH